MLWFGTVAHWVHRLFCGYLLERRSMVANKQQGVLGASLVRLQPTRLSTIKTPVPHTIARACMGCVGVNTGTASLADAPTGLSARDRTSFCGQVVIAANLTSESQRQACCGPLCSMSDKDAGGGQKHTVSPLPELWRNEWRRNSFFQERDQ